MSQLIEKANALLSEGIVELIVGFEEGASKVRPFFCHHAEETVRLVLDDRCTHNLAVYLTKPELIGNGRVALTATLPVLRSIVQLSVENQLKIQELLVIFRQPEGELRFFTDIEEIKNYLISYPLTVSDESKAQLAVLKGMPRDERWRYWIGEMSRCIKCYACRAACPLCYCSRCIVEVNCPQWVQPWSAPLSNMEWQINRVMHMAGRCTGCGACKQACPVGIPIHLLTLSMADDIKEEFAIAPGTFSVAGNVLSTYRENDKEGFIH